MCFSPKSSSVAVMPARKTATKRKSEPVVEDDKDPKKVKGKSLVFKTKTRSLKATRLDETQVSGH